MAEDQKGPEDEPRPMSQDEIDSLFSNLQDEQESASIQKNDRNETEIDEAEQAEEVDAESGGPLGQTDIDNLLEEVGAEDVAASAVPAPPSGDLSEDEGKFETKKEGTGGPPPKVALDQNDIDALLNQLNEEESETKADAAGSVSSGTAETIIQEDLEPAPASKAFNDESSMLMVNEISESDSEAMVGQSEIDNLLQEMGINDDSPVASPSSGQLLSTEEIVGIVQKNEESTAGSVSDSISEAMIDQSDIDALVREMSEATGVPDQHELDEKIANQNEDIEALLQEAASPMVTSDAIKGSVVFGQQSMGQQGMNFDQAAVMAPDELRGTKYLLVAAVFLLAMCAVTMGFVVSAINGLAIELEQNRMSEIKPLDDFQENIAFAKKMLSGEDDIEVIQGVKFVSQLKENYDKDPEKIIMLSLLMADHYRSKGAYSKAEKEYVVMTERQGTLYDNPQHYLDYADTLFSIGSQHYDEASTIIYRLLANEQYYLSPQDLDGEPRLENEIEENKRVLQAAHLMLGRIYTAQLSEDQQRGGT